MPDCYTHVHTALQALLRGSQTVASLPCYIAGANGPTPFYMYQFWNRERQPNLAALADRMHREKTGKFLSALLDLAITGEQQSYAMGFLTHYTTDCTLNPYIAALGDMGLYHGKKERAQFEASIDSALFYKNYRTRMVPLYAATPMLMTDDLGQVSELLHDALLATYEMDVPVVNLADAFHDNLTMRKKMISPRGGRRFWAKLTAPIRVGSKRAAPMLAHIQPAPPLPPLPEKWKNPYSGEEIHLTFDEIMVLTEQTGAVAITAAMRYWLGEIDAQKLMAILGDNNYYTGRPTSAAVPSAQKETPAKGAVPQQAGKSLPPLQTPERHHASTTFPAPAATPPGAEQAKAIGEQPPKTGTMPRRSAQANPAEKRTPAPGTSAPSSRRPTPPAPNPNTKESEP